MKEYIKPEVECIKFDSENVLVDLGDGSTDIVSSDVSNPWDP